MGHNARTAPPPPAHGPFDKLGPGNYHRIAREAGLTAAHVSRILRAVRGVSLPVAERIAQAAGVTLGELVVYMRMQKLAASRRIKRQPHVDPHRAKRKAARARTAAPKPKSRKAA